MSERETGGPAFPTLDHSFPSWDQDNIKRWEHVSEAGMTLRDYFAAHVVAGLTQNWPNTSSDTMAARAYELADAMLKARENAQE